MIPALIYLFLRRFYKSNTGQAPKFLRAMIQILFTAMGLTLIGKMANSQDRKLNYEVIRNNQPAGYFAVQCSSYANKNWYRLESRISTRVIFRVRAESREESQFENGILVFSSFRRMLNGNATADKKILKTTKGYEIQRAGIKGPLRFPPIHFNTLSLFFNEPLNRDSVFSENFQHYIQIHRIREHLYQLNFPDGSHNRYHYQNGICSMIEISSTFFDAKVVLQNELCDLAF